MNALLAHDAPDAHDAHDVANDLMTHLIMTLEDAETTCQTLILLMTHGPLSYLARRFQTRAGILHAMKDTIETERKYLGDV